MIHLKKLFFSNQSFAQTILKNTSWTAVATGIGKISKFIMMIIVARQLSPDEFGQFNYVISLSALYFCFSEIGISNIVNREYQQKKQDPIQLLASGWAIKQGLVLIHFICAMIGYLFVSSNLSDLFLIFCVMHAIDSLKQYKINLTRIKHQQELEAMCFLIETITTSISCIVLILYFHHHTNFCCSCFSSK